MVTTETGEFFSTVPDQGAGTWLYTGNLSVTGDVVTGTGQTAFIHPDTCDFPICFFEGSPTVSGTVSQRSSLALNGISSSGPSSGSSSWSYNDLYNQPSSLAAIAGNWIGSVSANDTDNAILNISSTGVVYEQDAFSSCIVTGQVSLINPAYNAYDVALTYSDNCQGNFSGLTGKGIASLNTSVTPTLLEMVVTWSNSNNPGVLGISLFEETTYQSAGGIWTATIPNGTALMLVSETGEFFFYETAMGNNCTELYAGTLSVSATDTVSGSGVFSPSPSAAVCGVSAESATFTGTVVPYSTMTLTSMNGGISTTLNWTNNTSLYNVPSSLATIAGSWLTPELGSNTLAISATGVISGVDAASGCVINGQVFLITPSFNAYSFTETYSNCASVPADLSNSPLTVADLNGTPVTGLASIDNTVTPNLLNTWLEFPTSSDGTIIATIQATRE